MVAKYWLRHAAGYALMAGSIAWLLATTGVVCGVIGMMAFVSSFGLIGLAYWLGDREDRRLDRHDECLANIAKLEAWYDKEYYGHIPANQGGMRMDTWGDVG